MKSTSKLSAHEKIRIQNRNVCFGVVVLKLALGASCWGEKREG